MPKKSVAQRVFLSGIGVALALIGAVFCGLMWRSFDRARTMEAWPEVSCAILESGIEARRDDPEWPEAMPQEYRFRVLYRYEWDDRVFEADRLSLRGASWSSRRAKAERWVAKYPRGSVANCRVNPAAPAEAVLEVDSKAPGYSLWFPLLFVVGGLGIAIGAWRRDGGPDRRGG
jgi:hypothetical protein